MEVRKKYLFLLVALVVRHSVAQEYIIEDYSGDYYDESTTVVSEESEAGSGREENMMLTSEMPPEDLATDSYENITETAAMIETTTVLLEDAELTEASTDEIEKALEVVDIESEEADDVANQNIFTDCSESEFGCCPDNAHPAHGSENLGCCSFSEFGCCPDLKT